MVEHCRLVIWPGQRLWPKRRAAADAARHKGLSGRTCADGNSACQTDRQRNADNGGRRRDIVFWYQDVDPDPCGNTDPGIFGRAG